MHRDPSSCPVGFRAGPQGAGCRRSPSWGRTRPQGTRAGPTLPFPAAPTRGGPAAALPTALSGPEVPAGRSLGRWARPSLSRGRAGAGFSRAYLSAPGARGARQPLPRPERARVSRPPAPAESQRATPRATGRGQATHRETRLGPSPCTPGLCLSLSPAPPGPRLGSGVRPPGPAGPACAWKWFCWPALQPRHLQGGLAQVPLPGG